ISLVNVSEVVPFLAFVCLLMFAEKIPVHLISVATCFAMYVVKQQLTTEFNAHVKRLTVDLTTWDAIFVVEGQRILTMVDTVIETVNEITTNYESLRDQLDQITEMGSVAPLISEQFAGLSVSTSNFSQRSSGSSLGSSSGSSTLNKIDTWIDSKNNFNLANNTE
ncbi:337_t:CDS:1, partial [Dentiscutata heterogama]